MSTGRRFLQVVAILGTLIVGVASMAVIVTQTTWFKEWLRGFIIKQADDYVNGRLTIGRIDGNLFFGVEAEDIDITQNGMPVVSLKDVGVDYNFLTFLGGNVVLDHIRLNEPQLHLKRTATGWNLAGLIKAQTPNAKRARSRSTSARSASATARSTGQPRCYVRRGGAEGDRQDRCVRRRHQRRQRAEGRRRSRRAARTESEIRRQRPVGDHSPARGQHHLRERGAADRRDLAARRRRRARSRQRQAGDQHQGLIRQVLDGRDGAHLPSLRGYENLQPAFEVNASGPADRLEVQANVREKDIGQVAATSPRHRRSGAQRHGRGADEHFNAGPLVRGAMFKTDVTGHATLDIAFPASGMPLRGTYSVNATRANVIGYRGQRCRVKGRIDWPTITVDGSAAGYGGRATAMGTIDAASPLRLDLSGKAAHVDLRNVPPQLNAPGVPSNLQFSYTITGRGPVLSGDLVMESRRLRMRRSRRARPVRSASATARPSIRRRATSPISICRRSDTASTSPRSTRRNTRARSPATST